MAASVTTKPTYAVPNRPTTVIFTPGDGATNYIRVWATTAPEGTALRKKIDDDRRGRALLFQGNAGGTAPPWRTSFEKGGAYSLLLQEYTKGNAWGGGYENDPRGAPSETKNGGEQSLTLYIAQRMTQTLGVSPDTAELVLFVVNGTVRETLAAVHGETSPAIQNPSSDRASLAAGETDVLTQLPNLKNQVVATALFPGFTASLGSWLTSFAAHSISTTFHQLADSQADLVSNYATSGTDSPDIVVPLLNKLRARYSLHISNATEASPTPGSIVTHDQAGLRQDLPHRLLPVTADASDPTSVIVAMADYVRAYELHRVAAMHENPDGSNFIGFGSSPQLLTLHRVFLEALVQTDLAVPPGQTSGAAKLRAIGFEET